MDNRLSQLDRTVRGFATWTPADSSAVKRPSSGCLPVNSRACFADFASDDHNGLCYYHYVYADKAHRCVKPCSWSTKND